MLIHAETDPVSEFVWKKLSNLKCTRQPDLSNEYLDSSQMHSTVGE